MLTLYRTGEYRDPRSSASDIQRIDAGVATIDLELDAPDDVIDVVPEPSGVTVELADAEMSDASLDRLAGVRAANYRFPVETPSYVAPVEGSYQSVCQAPCAKPCHVMMAEEPCDPSPEVRCAQSLERIGVACPSQCSDVCPMVEPTSTPPTAVECPSKVDGVCQTEPTWSSRASSLATGTETETDFDELYSDQTDDICKVSCAILRLVFLTSLSALS